MLLGIVASLLALIALVFAGFTLFAAPAPTPALDDLAPYAELDRRWGSYLSEREWGTPREAVGTNGWGLNWTEAISTDYRYSDDGIAGMTDLNNEFRLGWGFWTATESHVTERFNGLGNPQGPAGEQITDDRIFQENSPTHAYQRLTYRYPREMPWFSIDLEAARYDSATMTMVATVTNNTSQTRSLDVVFRASLAPGQEVEPIEDGLLLPGSSSVVAVVGQPPSEWQISPDKGALDANLRAEGLVGDQGGGYGALAYRLEIPAGSEGVIRIGVAEQPKADNPNAPALATDAAQSVLALSDGVIGARRTETGTLFDGQVTEHERLYRQALMSLLWNETYYRWDGATGINPTWSGKVDARDVLILPDKWEFPWLASWDSAFHAVTASLVDHGIAQDQLRFMLSDRWQQPDGHIPCAEWVMDNECPPIFAWAAWRVFEQSNDTEFLQQVYPGLQRNYDYWWARNQVGDALFTGGFLGMDNLPRSGFGTAQADATAWMALFARDMARIASELGDQPTSERYWIDRGRIQEQINATLWDEQSGFYYDLTPTGEFIDQKSYSGLIPLIAGVVPPERLPPILAALRDEQQLMSVGGIRSLSSDSPFYRPGLAGAGVNSNWRGPVWVPINYMLIESLMDVDPSLAAEIRRRVVENVESDWQDTSRLHEYFDGDTGEGLGADQQAGWTALVANMILEGWPAAPPDE
ncbi:MAG TPA: trehalase family glycosidase [Candidatus Limnocylindrales bacterium]|nr:trehalase family glycosidase [Candidatus Limnocylindrales bacterium]